MQINIKIKQTFLFFSFLSLLFPYEIFDVYALRAEDVIGTIGVVNWKKPKNHSKINLPYKKGSYLVCPNGKAVEKYLLEYSPINKLPYDKEGDYWISSEVVIGKTPKSYSTDEKNAIMKNFLEKGGKPTSYKSTFIGLNPISFNWNRNVTSFSWLYKFKNSENKEVSIDHDRRDRYGIIFNDNKGNTFTAVILDSLRMLFCTNDHIVYRSIERLVYNGTVYKSKKLQKNYSRRRDDGNSSQQSQQIDDGNSSQQSQPIYDYFKFNEKYDYYVLDEDIKLPIIFWIKEIGVKAKPLKIEKTSYEF